MRTCEDLSLWKWRLCELVSVVYFIMEAVNGSQPLLCNLGNRVSDILSYCGRAGGRASEG